MDLRQLQYFIAVYESGSISLASARLHVAQPAVSRSLQALAADLGVVLFERQGRGIRATEAAHRLHAHALQIMHDLETTRMNVQHVEKSPVGHLTLACTDQLGRLVTPPMLAMFHELYPQVSITIWEGTSSTVYDWVTSGTVDIAILTSPPKNPMIRVRHVHHEPMSVILSNHWNETDYAHLIKPVLSLEDLAELPLILPRRGNPHRTLIEQALAGSKRNAKISVEVDVVATITSLVVRGLACTVMLAKAAEYENRLGLVRIIPIAAPGISAAVSLLTPRDRLETQATREFIRLWSEPEMQRSIFEGGTFRDPDVHPRTSTDL